MYNQPHRIRLAPHRRRHRRLQRLHPRRPAQLVARPRRVAARVCAPHHRAPRQYLARLVARYDVHIRGLQEARLVRLGRERARDVTPDLCRTAEKVNPSAMPA